MLAQLYHGSSGYTNLRDQQRLYTRMQNAIIARAKKQGWDPTEYATVIHNEAERRGAIRPTPAKDF